MHEPGVAKRDCVENLHAVLVRHVSGVPNKGPSFSRVKNAKQCDKKCGDAANQ